MPLDSASLRYRSRPPSFCPLLKGEGGATAPGEVSGYRLALRAPFGPRLGCARAQVVFSILAFFAIPSTLFASPRTWQPLIIKGGQAPQLCKRPLNQFEVLAMRDGKLAAIPFQIDQINPDSKYVLPEGPQPVAPQHPGVLDAKDEIVMMIADLGERAKPEATLPPGAFEIAMSDPLGGPIRYAYIATDAHPILSPLHYVDYDAAKNSIDTDHYRFGYTRGVPSDYAPQSRKHEDGPNLLDRFKIRVRATVLKLFHFNLNEDKVDNRLLAWKVGPVRVVRLLTHSVRVVFGIRSPEVTNYDFFYRDCVENPFKVRFPWVPRVLFGDIKVRMDLDFTGLDGYAISWSRMHDGPLRIGDPKLLKISQSDPPRVEWIALRGGGRMIIQTIAPTSDLQLLDRRLYFNDDPNIPDPPERVRGEHPGIGYAMTGWENLASGSHTLVSMLIDAPQDYDADVLLREYQAPPSVAIRPVSSR